MRATTLLAVAAIGGLAAIVLGALVLGGGKSASDAAAASRDRLEIGAPAPRLAGQDPVGDRPISLSKFEGKPVVVTVWASWCSDCGKQAAALTRFRRAHPEAVLLGLDVHDTEEDAEAFYERFGWSHPSILDPEGRQAARLELVSLPTTLFLNEEHVIVTRVVGTADLEELEHGLERAGGLSAKPRRGAL